MRIAARIGVFLLLVAASSRPAETPARELYQSLTALRVDATQVYTVRDLTLRRDAVRLSLSEGKLAFLQPLGGRVVGAVFTGHGRILTIPRDSMERRSVARFLGTPLVDETFSRAYLRFTDGTAAELEKELRESGAHPDSDPDFATEWNPVVSGLNPWHSLRTMADWLAASPRPYFCATLQGDRMGPFDAIVDDRRPEQVLLGQARWASGVHYYDLWASFRRSEAPEGPVETAVPVAYTVDTSIQADLKLEGRATLTLRAVRDGERVLEMEISRALAIESITDDAGHPLPVFQNEDLSRSEIATRGNDSFLVVLPEPTRAGKEFRLRASYRGSVISDAGNGVYFVGDRGSWFPHVGGLANFAAYDLTFRWPRKLTLVATGKKTEEREDGDWRVGHWRSQEPMAVAGFNLGEYATQTIESGGVRIAVHANRELEEAILQIFQAVRADEVQNRPAGWGRNRPQGPPTGGVFSPPPPPIPAMVLEKLSRDIADSIHYLERWNGPFPFDHLEISQIPGSFGQGWPALLYLSTLAFLSPDAQARAGVGSREQASFTQVMPFHEVGHQWWGNLAGFSSYRDEWINESLANYTALMYLESKQPDHVLTGILQGYRSDLLAKLPGSEQSYDEAGPLALGERLRSSKAPEGYARVTYAKGTWVIHILRSMLRDPAAKDPDWRFAALLHGLLEEHRHIALPGADVQRAVERVMTPDMALEGGRSMDWFFDQWVRGTGIPRYAVDFTATPQGASFLVRGTLKQTGVPENFIARVPLYAPAASGKPVLLGTVVTSGAETSFRFTARARPKRLLIDPNLTLLCRTD
jgi:hypothetical protein